MNVLTEIQKWEDWQYRNRIEIEGKKAERLLLIKGTPMYQVVLYSCNSLVGEFGYHSAATFEQAEEIGLAAAGYFDCAFKIEYNFIFKGQVRSKVVFDSSSVIAGAA